MTKAASMYLWSSLLVVRGAPYATHTVLESPFTIMLLPDLSKMWGGVFVDYLDGASGRHLETMSSAQ